MYLFNYSCIRKFDNVVKDLTARCNELEGEYDELFLMAHSMGGLVVARALGFIRTRVVRVFCFDTPWFGLRLDRNWQVLLDSIHRMVDWTKNVY